MQRLLYHAPDNPNQDSPFDRAIIQVVQDQQASIVSPYIGLEYLHRLIRLSSSWRLISDVLEWLSATPVRERSAVYEFLKVHEGLVRHYPAIHAKTVVSRVGAYTGSANLTGSGVLRRTEFGVLLTDSDHVLEIQQWFDALWEQTSTPPLQRVLELISELNQISHMAAKFADLQATPLESEARRVRAKLVNILGHEPKRLVARHAGTTSVPKTQAAPAQPHIPRPPEVQSPMPTPGDKPSQTGATSPALPPSSFPAPAVTFALEEEVAAYVAANAQVGFKFADLHQAMRSKSPSLTMRETYLTILEFCASHPRVLFLPDAMNRLVYTDRRFVQSNRELLTNALKPVDEMVSRMIERLSFDDAATKQEELESQLVPVNVLRILLKSMVRSGFVAQVQSGFKLVPTATWSPRLRLLERAHSKWSSRLNAHRSKPAPVFTADVQRSQLSVSPQEATADALCIEHTDDHGLSQEELISRRSVQLDTVFSHLAELRAQNGEKTKIGLNSLKISLMGMSGLSENDVSRLLNGTYYMYRSPFLAFVTGSLGTVSIVADLEANPHLEALPNTRATIKKHKVLLALESPAPPHHISLEGGVEDKGVKTSFDRLKDVDKSYLEIANWIFQNKPPAGRTKERTMIMTLSASGVPRDTLRRLLLDTAFRFPRLFSLEKAEPGKQGSRSPALRLHHDKLLHYPATSSFLKTVVWPSGTTHPWLPAPPPGKALFTENLEKLTLREMARKSYERDKNYAFLIAYIEKKIPRFGRFKSRDELASALNGSGVERFIIDFLIGIGHKPPDQLMMVQEDGKGLFLKFVPAALHSYPRSRKLLDKPVPEGAYPHPWLTDEASIAARPALAPALSVPPSSVPSELAALRADGDNRSVIDTLYVDLARFYVKGAVAAKLNPEKSAHWRAVSVEKYLKICEIRKSSGKNHEPVLSLEIHDGAEKQVELVIYRGYRAYIQHYPKLQRYLETTSLKLREV